MQKVLWKHNHGFLSLPLSGCPSHTPPTSRVNSAISSEESFGFALLTSLAIITGCSAAFHVLYQRFPQLYDLSSELLGISCSESLTCLFLMVKMGIAESTGWGNGGIRVDSSIFVFFWSRIQRPLTQAERGFVAAYGTVRHFWMGQSKFQFEVRPGMTGHSF